MYGEQLPLFPQKGVKGEYVRPSGIAPALSVESSLVAAIGAFHEHMVRENFTENTIRSFRSDLRLLTRHLGAGRAIGTIGTDDLNSFLTWLLQYRGVPCNPKSYARRVTTLKVFFGWLTKQEILPADPSAAVVHHRVSTPLPRILYKDHVERLLDTTRRLMEAEEKPDARPYLLVSLLLHTGIKKGECMAIGLDHIDLSDPARPVLYVRYNNPRMRKKERKLRLPPDFSSTFARYRAQYQPRERLFECTARNLEYVLADMARLADIAGSLSFEMLRWTCAVRDFQAGTPLDRLRLKLGLSEVTWREASEKIRQLASPPL